VTCFNVELKQFLALFRIAWVCQQQLSILVYTYTPIIRSYRHHKINNNFESCLQSKACSCCGWWYRHIGFGAVPHSL